METIVGLIFVISATLMANDAIDKYEGKHKEGDIVCAVIERKENEIVKIKFKNCLEY